MNVFYPQAYYYGYAQAPYYREPDGMPPAVSSGGTITPGGTVTTVQPLYEESYIENILRLNRGKLGTFYMTYDSNSEWNARIFKGIIEAAGRDHIVISDQTQVKDSCY